MTEMTKRERFQKALSNEVVDRPLVATWCHFLAEERDHRTLAATTVEYATKFDWDWIKYNPRAIYLPEAWGNEYDYNSFEWVFPRLTKSILSNRADLENFASSLSVDLEPFDDQIKGIKLVQEALPDTPVVATVFSPLSVLLLLAGLPISTDGFANTAVTSMTMTELFVDNADLVDRVLPVIADALARYFTKLDEAGVDGVFYATTSTAALFTEEQFDRFSAPYDRTVLEAAGDLKVILHTCGDHSRPDFFADYPVSALSWDTHAEGNMSIIDGSEVALPKACGISRHAFDQGDIPAVTRQVERALGANKGVPFLLSPDCAVSSATSESVLHAFRASLAS